MKGMLGMLLVLLTRRSVTVTAQVVRSTKVEDCSACCESAFEALGVDPAGNDALTACQQTGCIFTEEFTHGAWSCEGITSHPTSSPSVTPTYEPTELPTGEPTNTPTTAPSTSNPTTSPSTSNPTKSPSLPTNSPTTRPPTTRPPTTRPPTMPTCPPWGCRRELKRELLEGEERAGCELGRDLRLVGGHFEPSNEGFRCRREGELQPKDVSDAEEAELVIDAGYCSECCWGLNGLYGNKTEASYDDDIFDIDSCKLACNTTRLCFQEEGHRERLGCAVGVDFITQGSVTVGQRTFRCKKGSVSEVDENNNAPVVSPTIPPFGDEGGANVLAIVLSLVAILAVCMFFGIGVLLKKENEDQRRKYDMEKQKMEEQQALGLVQNAKPDLHLSRIVSTGDVEVAAAGATAAVVGAAALGEKKKRKKKKKDKKKKKKKRKHADSDLKLKDHRYEESEEEEENDPEDVQKPAVSWRTSLAQGWNRFSTFAGTGKYNSDEKGQKNRGHIDPDF